MTPDALWWLSVVIAGSILGVAIRVVVVRTHTDTLIKWTLRALYVGIAIVVVIIALTLAALLGSAGPPSL